MKLSIIVPVYNEENTIVDLLKKVSEVRLSKNIVKEIIVINDGSTDRSKSRIEASKLVNEIKLISYKENSGKGAAIRRGLKEVTGDFIIIQDADLEYSPDDYKKLLQPLIDKKGSVVYGTRLKKYPLKFWGEDKTVLPMHLLANKLLTFLTNILYGSNLSDMETCYKMFDASVIKNINLQSNGFDFEPEITAKMLKQRIKILEVPIKTKPRSYGEGKKIGWSDGLIAIWTLIKYRFVN